jgi:hypothetical protein
MTRLPLLALAACTILTVSAQAAAPEPQRLRGTIVSSDATSLTLHPADGADVKVMLGAGVHFAGVVASDIKAIQPGSFIGTATKGFGSRMTALEVVVFPPELRGQGEGHYKWDKLPDSSGSTVASSMTNGTVEAGHKPLVGSSMTNGNIDAATAQDGALHIAVSYKGGHKDIVVPAGAPVVAFKLAGPEIVKKGAQAFIVAVPDGSGIQAKFVAVGEDGVKPPM